MKRAAGFSFIRAGGSAERHKRGRKRAAGSPFSGINRGPMKPPASGSGFIPRAFCTICSGIPCRQKIRFPETGILRPEKDRPRRPWFTAKKETAKRLAATLTVSHGNKRYANVCHRKNPSGGNFLFIHNMPVRPQQPKTRFIPS